MSEEKGSSTVSDSCVDNLVLAQEIFGKNNIKWISSRNKFWTRNFIQNFYIDTKIWKILNAPFIPAYSGGFEVLAYFHVKFVIQRENTDVEYPFPISEGVIRLGRSFINC